MPCGNRKTALPKKQLFYPFTLLCLLLVGYFVYLSIQYDLVTGGFASILTGSFFVRCTPIADAGFLLDFPLRLLFDIRRLVSEIVVWAIALTINAISLVYFFEYHETTKLTALLDVILTGLFPY
jgi:hypothetical protein